MLEMLAKSPRFQSDFLTSNDNGILEYPSYEDLETSEESVVLLDEVDFFKYDEPQPVDDFDLEMLNDGINEAL